MLQPKGTLHELLLWNSLELFSFFISLSPGYLTVPSVMKVTQSPSNKVLVFKCWWTFLSLTIQKCYQIMLRFKDCVEKEGGGGAGGESTKTRRKSDQFHPLHWWKHVEGACSHLLQGEVRISFCFSVPSQGFSHTDFLLFLGRSRSALASVWSQHMLSLCSRHCYHITSPSTSKELLLFEISVKYHFFRENSRSTKTKHNHVPQAFCKH